MPRIPDSQPNSIAFVRVASVRPPPPHYPYVCVLRWNVWAVRGTCLAVAEHVLRMRGRPERRGGSKACLSIGASYHWYPCDLYCRWRPHILTVHLGLWGSHTDEEPPQSIRTLVLSLQWPSQIWRGPFQAFGALKCKLGLLSPGMGPQKVTFFFLLYSFHRWRIVFNCGCPNTHRGWRTPIPNQTNTHSQAPTPTTPIRVFRIEKILSLVLQPVGSCRYWRLNTYCLLPIAL